MKSRINDFFKDKSIESKFYPYTTEASDFLVKAFESLTTNKGITITASGFYGPQSRKLRAKTDIPDLYNLFDDFDFEGLKITNLEMETSGIFALASILGHKAISLNAILANRKKGSFSTDPEIILNRLIQQSLEIISDKILL